jgi:uroporphyrinogen-III synthase
MLGRIVSVNQLKALRLIRAGSATDRVCRALGLRPDSIRSLEIACRNVPDDILARLEQALTANEKLRRLVAGLGRSVSEMTGTESD